MARSPGRTRPERPRWPAVEPPSVRTARCTQDRTPLEPPRRHHDRGTSLGGQLRLDRQRPDGRQDRRPGDGARRSRRLDRMRSGLRSRSFGKAGGEAAAQSRGPRHVTGGGLCRGGPRSPRARSRPGHRAATPRPVAGHAVCAGCSLTGCGQSACRWLGVACRSGCSRAASSWVVSSPDPWPSGRRSSGGSGSGGGCWSARTSPTRRSSWTPPTCSRPVLVA